MVSLRTALSYAIQSFSALDINSANLDAQLILSFLLDKPLSYIFSHLDTSLPYNKYKRFKQLVYRRSKLEPIAYIIGKKEFYGYSFFINKNVLIPRPDTELLIDIVKGLTSSKEDRLYILDLGTGSGCIIITLLLELHNSVGLGTDISKQALSVAVKNSKSYKLDNRLELIKSDWFKKLPISDNQKYDIIITNPPYISEDEINLMATETLLFEPKNALFAYNNGLEAYEIIARSAKNYLKKDGKLIVEIGFKQQQKVIDLFLAQTYQLVEKYQDLAGHNRAIMFK